MSGRVLIYGGRGGLGSVLVSHFKRQGWWICSVDILEMNDEADANVIVDPNCDWLVQEEHVVTHVEKHLSSGEKFDSIINMAGMRFTKKFHHVQKKLCKKEFLAKASVSLSVLHWYTW